MSRFRALGCEGKPATWSLREAVTLHLDSHIRKCALELQDQCLLAKLSGGDMIASEAKCHAKCLVSPTTEQLH